MAKEILYNFNYLAPAQITREDYLNVGSGSFQLGGAARGFKGGTDFEIWDSAVGGTQLVENTDYELLDVDNRLSVKAGYNVYTRVRIITPAYQTGNIYITYKVVISYVDASFYNNLYNIAISAGGSNIKYLTNADSPFTITDSDGFGKIICNTSGGDIIINTPTPANNQNRELSFVHQVGGGIVTVNGTIDGLTSVELPKQYDRMTILGTTPEWAILEERISCQLRLDTYAGYGSTDTKIMRFTNTVENYGNMFNENHSTGYNGNTEGLEITINKTGKYSFDFTAIAGATNYILGLSLNSSQKSTNVWQINIADKLILSASAVGLGEASCSTTKIFKKNDVIAFHTTGSAITETTRVLASVNYIGN